MAVQFTLDFDYEINTSLQIGDEIYHSTPQSVAEFTIADGVGSLIHVGTVIDIYNLKSISVYSEYTDSNNDLLPANTPTSTSYISFSKNKVVNNSDLLGYYAEVEFINNSNSKAELFSVASEISENSK
tara:strand:- start:2773 stop:3156 length:384 start_codon:yes stop_codon:yes gene_type:complete